MKNYLDEIFAEKLKSIELAEYTNHTLRSLIDAL